MALESVRKTQRNVKKMLNNSFKRLDKPLSHLRCTSTKNFTLRK